MPHKGFFTQGAVVLTDAALTASAVDAALSSFDVRKRSPADGERNWVSGYPSWVIAMRPEVNGVVVLEVVDAPWPDDMGNPTSPSGKMLFGAWSMGFMGPFTWPGCLARATQFATAFGSKGVATAAFRHRAFVRIRSTYVTGAGADAKIMPADYDARTELDFVTAVAQAVSRAPGTLCYFNPGGETLFTPQELDEQLQSLREQGLTPLPVWTCGRLMKIDDAPPWMVGDVVGMAQLDAQDHEAAFRRDRHDAGEVMAFLRNISMYTLEHGNVIKSGHTTDGPGGPWRALAVEEGVMPAPRPVLRWFPEDGSEPPAALRKPTANAPANAPSGTGLLGKLKSLFGK